MIRGRGRPGLGPESARLALRCIGAAGLTVGAGSLAMPRLGLRLVGLEAEGSGLGLMARLFGCRDLVLCGALLRQASRPRPELSWVDAIAVMQVGDIAVGAALWRAGALSRRGLAVILASAPPTLVAALLARRGLAAGAA